MKIILMVLDSFGIGGAEDAFEYGDQGANTYLHIVEQTGMQLHNMVAMGLNHIDGVGLDTYGNPTGKYARLIERSKGKDTTTGHFEIAGIVSERAFPTYPNGFPKEVIRAFEQKIGTKTLFNGVASGTEIINRFGDEHMRTGYPIVYTSADSVFQVAMSEEIIPIERQKKICEIARAILSGDHNVARVIMRPFVKKGNQYVRTENRRDYSVKPPKHTMLDRLKDAGYTTYAIGKIEDIFAGCGITQIDHSHNNGEGLEATLKALKEDFDGLIFTNLVDTDMIYGHRRDVEGYRRSLEATDAFLPKITQQMQAGDILMLTGDHGCDPTYRGTDHTRENVPLLIYGDGIGNLGTKKGFTFIAEYILEKFGLKL